MALKEVVTSFHEYLMYRLKWGANIKYIPPVNGVYIGYTVCFRTVGYSPQTHRISITYIYIYIYIYIYRDMHSTGL